MKNREDDIKNVKKVLAEGDMKKVSGKNLSGVKVGDLVVRVLGGILPLVHIVGYVDDKIIKVGSQDGLVPWQEGWTFDINTGFEIDEELGWTLEKGVTGSYITHIVE